MSNKQNDIFDEAIDELEEPELTRKEKWLARAVGVSIALIIFLVILPKFIIWLAN